MASRVSEVLYKLRDFFTAPAKKIESGYARLRKSSKKTADGVAKDAAKMQKSLGTLGSKVKALSGFFAGGLLARGAAGSFSDVANELDRLGKVAKRLDLDPNTLSAFEFAAERAGISTSRVVASLETLQKRTGEAVQGLGRAKIAFDTLGISADEFIKLGVEEQLFLLADGISTLADEETRAATAAQLFSKQNTELLQLIGNGSAELKNLVEQGKAYREITKEQTEAAAAYNDALANLGRQIDAIKFDKLTPALSEFSEFLDNIGAGDPIAGITAELAVLEANLKRNPLERLLRFESRPAILLRRRINELRTELRLLTREQKEATDEQKKNAEALKAAQQVTATYQGDLEALTDTYEAQAAARRGALEQETKELEKARKDQAAIEKEFKNLVDDITAPPQKEVFLIDLFNQINQARAALEGGETDQALTLARQGGDLLGQLKEKGTETQGTLSFLAKQLQRIGVEAAQTKVDAEIVDVDQATKAFATIQQKADILTQTAPAAGSAYAKAFLDAMRVEFENETLPAPRVAASAPARNIVRDGDEYRYETELEGRARK